MFGTHGTRVEAGFQEPGNELEAFYFLGVQVYRVDLTIVLKRCAKRSIAIFGTISRSADNGVGRTRKERVYFLKCHRSSPVELVVNYIC